MRSAFFLLLLLLSPHHAFAAMVWTTEIVDATGNVGGFSSIAIDSNNTPVIAYYDATNNDLRFATKASGVWSTQLVAAVSPSPGPNNHIVGQNLSMKLDANNVAHISHEDFFRSDLLYSTNASGNWMTTVADNALQVGLQTSLDLDSNGRPVVAHLDTALNSLRFSKFNGSTWSSTNPPLDPPGRTGFHPSLVLDSNDLARIAYFNSSQQLLKLGQQDSLGNWSSAAVGTENGLYPSLALGADGRPMMSFYNQATDTLKFARFNGTTWDIQTIEAIGSASSGVDVKSSLALDANGNPLIAYWSPAGNSLKFAAYNGTAWDISVVHVGSGYNPSLALDSQGNAFISYYHDFSDDLRIAYGQRISSEVPEPASAVLALLGGTGLLLRRRRDA